MIEVIDGKLGRRVLPKSGKLKDGRTVSGYNELPRAVLIEEGWLPLVDIEPEYDPATHEAVHGGYDIQKDKVFKLYDVVELVEPGPSDIEILEMRADAAEEMLVQLLMEGGM